MKYTDLTSEEVVNSLKMRLFLGMVFSFFVVVTIFAPFWFFMLIICWLITDYFVLMGGTLNWLNYKVDKEFKGTSFFRRLLASDARMILATTSIAIIVLTAEYFLRDVAECCHLNMQWSDKFMAHTLHMVYAFAYYSDIVSSGTKDPHVHGVILRSYIFPIVIRGLLIGNLIHVIHHLLIKQRLAGVKFTRYPPVLHAVNKLVTWARK